MFDVATVWLAALGRLKTHTHYEEEITLTCTVAVRLAISAFVNASRVLVRHS
ncbi:uncharacterized protein PHALS_01081 [Plasmopara halstedii]|uniref:Uncharacterized protein n=1 Tax=Plasmopara halstedii TaxID=4781 RepID=A0A0P1AT22_PLAHL|nr:uncharacterized protein PHALS_01081 [Plasmopara halstedii]CEG44741.1 hypothetical protein PHALS_01081 [Plasmopara halstedii]|eukprot:XP_024581110.1 hypothetical protein PHALS_01081 [Plasmopara halstedii]